MAADVRNRAASAAAIEMLVARIEVAAHMVDGLDRRLGQIGQAVEGAAKRGRTNTALSAMEGSAALKLADRT